MRLEIIAASDKFYRDIIESHGYTWREVFPKIDYRNIGEKGGVAGRGKSKVRGDSDYYSKIGKLRKTKCNPNHSWDRKEENGS